MVDATALAAARTVLESTFTDVCTIDRPATAWDEEDQQSVTTYTPLHTGVPCRVPDNTSQGRVIVTGETITPVNPLVKVPTTITGVEPDDRVTITASADPELVGAVMWVTNPKARTLATSRTMECRWVR